MITTKQSIIIGLLVLALVGAGAGWYFFIQFGKGNETSQSPPEILIRPSEYDLGEVDIEGGKVHRTFKVFNQGEGKLKINAIKTSCGCTTARLIYKQKVSPAFGMHSSSLFWSETIAPGEGAQLKVTLDPAAHGKEGMGPFVRAIWITSNDPYNEKIEVRLRGKVVTKLNRNVKPHGQLHGAKLFVFFHSIHGYSSTTKSN